MKALIVLPLWVVALQVAAEGPGPNVRSDANTTHDVAVDGRPDNAGTGQGESCVFVVLPSAPGAAATPWPPRS